MTSLVVAAVDVGKPANIGWWRRASPDTAGHDLDELAGQLAGDLDRGSRVALGFEAPLFVPVPDSAEGLNRQRAGERGRPWCAGAGSAVLAMAAQQMAYLLREIRSLVSVHPQVGFDPASLSARGPVLVLWEAFVSGMGKDRNAVDPHVADARAAVVEFCSRLDGPDRTMSDIDEPDVLSVAGAALLASGLSEDLTLLRQACVVVRAPDLTRPAP